MRNDVQNQVKVHLDRGGQWQTLLLRLGSVRGIRVVFIGLGSLGAELVSEQPVVSTCVVMNALGHSSPLMENERHTK